MDLVRLGMQAGQVRGAIDAAFGESALPTWHNIEEISTIKVESRAITVHSLDISETDRIGKVQPSHPVAHASVSVDHPGSVSGREWLGGVQNTVDSLAGVQIFDSAIDAGFGKTVQAQSDLVSSADGKRDFVLGTPAVGEHPPEGGKLILALTSHR